MNILISIKSGFVRSLRNWKGLLINWLLTFCCVILVALPLRAALNSIFGSSMITEKLADGFNFDVIADMGGKFTTVMAFFSSGLFLAVMFGLLINAFVTGGLFSSLKGSNVKFSYDVFFRGAVSNFWSYIIIMLIISIIIIVAGFIVIGIPIIIASGSGSIEGSRLRAFLRFGSVFLLILPVFLLVADYARAWKVKDEDNRCFRAIGFGFKETFRTFSSSYPVMVILLIIQFLFGWLVISVLPGWRPSTGGGLLILFLISQFLFLTRIFLRVMRYEA
jgi:hypothetical protein